MRDKDQLNSMWKNQNAPWKVWSNNIEG
jgi:hypothetical protein